MHKARISSPEVYCIPGYWRLRQTRWHSSIKMGSVLENHAGNIVNMINNGATYSDVSTAFHISIGIERGHSVASMKKFLGDRNLVKRGHLSDDHLEVAVASAIREVSLFFYNPAAAAAATTKRCVLSACNLTYPV